MLISMSVRNIDSTTGTNVTTPEVNENLNTYNRLNGSWDQYKNNDKLNSKFKQSIEKKLNDLRELVNLPKEEQKNEEKAKIIADLINSLTGIINGNASMMSLDQRISCLTTLSNFKNSSKGKDLSDANHDEIYNFLNNTDVPDQTETSFYRNLYSCILDKYSRGMNQDIFDKIQKSINENTTTNINDFYSEFQNIVLNESQLLPKDRKSLETTYDSLAAFFNALIPALANYSVYTTEQNNISSSSRSNLHTSISSLVQQNNLAAYKQFEIDDFIHSKQQEREQTDLALKQQNENIYKNINKITKPKEIVNNEDELWIKKQE